MIIFGIVYRYKKVDILSRASIVIGKKLKNTSLLPVKVNMTNAKLNFCKIVLQEVCEKFNGTEEYIKKRIEELFNERKLSVEQATYLFTNNYKFC